LQILFRSRSLRLLTAIIFVLGGLLVSGGRAVRAGVNEPPATGSEQPVIYSAIANGPQTVTIAWTHTGNGVVNFNIEEKSNGVLPYSNVTTVEFDSHGGMVTGPPLQPGKPYYFRVCAVYLLNEVCSDANGVGYKEVTTQTGQTSTSSNAVPPIITGNDAGIDPSDLNTWIGLHWETDGTSYDYYEIHYEVQPASGTWQDPGTPARAPDSGSSGYHQVANLLPGTNYLFEIQGCFHIFLGLGGNGCDQSSSAYEATTPFVPHTGGRPTPTISAGDGSDATDISIGWTLPTPHNYDHYVIQYHVQPAAGGAPGASITAQVQGDESNYTAQNLTTGATYVFTVQGCDLALFPTPGPDCAAPSAPYTATASAPAPLVTTGGGTISGNLPPTLSLSVPTVTAGNTVTVTGQAFADSGDTVTLTLTSAGVPIVTLGTATVSQGGFSTTVTVPANTGPSSSYMVHAQATGAKADVSIQVTAPGSKQTLTVTDSNGVVATSISSDTPYTLTGTNFAPGFGVTLYLDSYKLTDPSKTGPQLGTATAGLQDETFTMSFDVTAAQIGNHNGDHTLVVVSNGFVLAQVTLPFVVLQGPR